MLPAINLSSVLMSADTHMAENCRKYKIHLHERRMRRNMEGFCIYQAYLRRLRSLHRVYVNKYKQLAARQVHPFVAQAPGQQQQRYDHYQLHQRQHQKWRSLAPDGCHYSSGCSHLKCCHDDQRRYQSLLHLRNKFLPPSLVQKGCPVHEPDDSHQSSEKPDDTRYGKMQKNQRTVNTVTETMKRFHISPTRFDNNDSNMFSPVVHGEDSSICEDSDSPTSPESQNKVELNHGMASKDPNGSKMTNNRVKLNPAAIHIPCGRDGSFCEPETPRQPVISPPAIKLQRANKSLPEHIHNALPFRVWKQKHASLGGTVYTDPVELDRKTK